MSPRVALAAPPTQSDPPSFALPDEQCQRWLNARASNERYLDKENWAKYAREREIMSSRLLEPRQGPIAPHKE